METTQVRRFGQGSSLGVLDAGAGVAVAAIVASSPEDETHSRAKLAAIEAAAIRVVMMDFISGNPLASQGCYFARSGASEAFIGLRAPLTVRRRYSTCR